ncbi:MAG: radical SAM protein [Candidatus Omnitrophota bacterium]
MKQLVGYIRSRYRLMWFYRGFFSVSRLMKSLVSMAFTGKAPFPLTVDMLITGRCNYSCAMCSWRGGRDDLSGELTLEDIDKFILQIKRYRPVVHIGGGEPFIRKDLPDIISIIKRNGLKCLVTTNGAWMDDGVVDRIVDLKVDVLIFSIYGWGDFHDEMTGVKGSFERTVANMRSVLKKRSKGTKVFVSTLPLSAGLDELGRVVENARLLGVDGVKIEQLNFMVRAEYDRPHYKEGQIVLEPYTLVRDSSFGRGFVSRLSDVYKDISKTYGGFVIIKPYLSGKQLSEWYALSPSPGSGCFFLGHSAVINYNGDIIPCQFFPGCVLGNIKKDRLKDVWHSKAYKECREAVNREKPIVCERCCKK